MSEYALLYAVLVAIYLLDCVAWLPSAVHPFRARPRASWSAAVELISLRSGRWAAWLAGVLPGTGGLAKAEARPLPISPVGLCACATQGSGVGKPTPFERLAGVRADDETLRLGSQAIARLATSKFASETAAWLGQLAAGPPERRASGIEARLGTLLDIPAARKALRRYRWCVGPLKWPVRLLGLAMYVVAPIAVLARGLIGSWPALVLVLFLLVAVMLLFAARLRRLDLARQAASDVTMMFLAPPLAIRADDLAGRDLLAGFHALAVARVACSDREARTLAAATLRSIRFPIAREDASCCEAAAWARSAWHRVIERWTITEFGSLDVLLTPPDRDSDRARGYCPRCLQQFEGDAGQCPDCDIGLRSFA